MYGANLGNKKYCSFKCRNIRISWQGGLQQHYDIEMQQWLCQSSEVWGVRCLEEMEAIVDCGELRKFKLTLCQHGLPFKSIAFFLHLYCRIRRALGVVNVETLLLDMTRGQRNLARCFVLILILYKVWLLTLLGQDYFRGLSHMTGHVCPGHSVTPYYHSSLWQCHSTLYVTLSLFTVITTMSSLLTLTWLCHIVTVYIVQWGDWGLLNHPSYSKMSIKIRT